MPLPMKFISFFAPVFFGLEPVAIINALHFIFLPSSSITDFHIPSSITSTQLPCLITAPNFCACLTNLSVIS